MKKLSLIIAALFVTTSVFAYYEDYSSSSSETSGWLIFLGIVMIIWGILEIILFFKIWSMTNDVKKLKEDHFFEKNLNNTGDLIVYLRKNWILGNKDNVKKALLLNFYNDVEAHFNPYGYRYYSTTNPVMEKDISPYVEKLIKNFAKVGEEVPEHIKVMKTYRDFSELFRPEELES